MTLIVIGLAAAACWVGLRVDWDTWNRGLQGIFARLGQVGQLLLTAAVATLFALTGWLTWLHPTGGAFRRLGDGPQTVLLAAVAALFYLSPWLLLNIASGVVLFILIFWRLDLGLMLIALSAPFYVYPKLVLGYRFSMVEMVTLMTLAAWILDRLLKANWKSQITNHKFRSGAPGPTLLHSKDHDRKAQIPLPFVPGTRVASQISRRLAPLSSLDLSVAFFVLVATLSLFFVERLDVASNEWRVVVVEPALFYLLLRASKLDKDGIWRVVDGFVLGGLVVAVLGLVWYVAAVVPGLDWPAAANHVITAEGGLPRLRSIYGSPNNVGLYLGRVIPILLAVALAGRGRRRWLYGLALFPTLAAVLFSFSKGAILLGMPVGIGLVLLCWRGRKAAAVLGGLAILALILLLLGSQVPTLSARLSLSGATTDFRVSLWKASVAMIKDHPWIGVGLDNFLYAYRGRYIRPEAWQEPSLSHPHNLLLDFWSRLGVLGLAAGIWMQVAFWRSVLCRVDSQRVLVIGLISSMGATLAHGLVDQTYFLIDLAYAFMLAAGLAALLARHRV